MNIKQSILITFSVFCLLSSMIMFGLFNLSYQDENINIDSNDIREKIDYKISKEYREIELNYNVVLNNETNKNLYDLNKFLINNDISNKNYDVENYNCIDFSNDLLLDLKDNNFKSGYASVFPNDISKYGHRFVWVEINNKLIFIEPQSDTLLDIYDLQDKYNNMIYSVDKVIIFNYKSFPIKYYFEYDIKDNKIEDEEIFYLI